MSRVKETNRNFLNGLFSNSPSTRDATLDKVQEYVSTLTGGGTDALPAWDGSRTVSPSLDMAKYASHPRLTKRAADESLRDPVRLMIREGEWVSNYIPPFTVTEEDFDRSLNSEAPWLIFEQEDWSPGAITLPFDASAPQLYLHGRKFYVVLRRYGTNTITKSRFELMTYETDLRKYLFDSVINEMNVLKNVRLMAMIYQFLRGPGQNTLLSGIPQWVVYNGGLSPNNLVEFTKIPTRTFSKLELKRCIMHTNTKRNFAKYRFMDIGETAADWWKSSTSGIPGFLGLDVDTTIQDQLIPENRIVAFCDPAYMGKHLVFHTPQVIVKNDEFNVSVKADAMDGATIINTNSFVIGDFQGA
jgi:hypothetical protein